MPKAAPSPVVMPEVTPTSYYGRPVVKPPTWKWMIPAYLFSGGLAAGTAMVAVGARALGDEDLATRATLASLGAVGASGVFLVGDLGRPSRFHHMLRVAKPSSPMSVGTWIFSAFAAFDGLAAVSAVTRAIGVGPLGPLGVVSAVSQAGAAIVAPALATYTGVLVADTAVPAWHEARGQLPWLFAASATASGAAAGVALTADRRRPTTAPLRILVLVAAAAELAADRVMHHHLTAITTGDPEAPDLAFPYRTGRIHRLSLGAKAATGLGALAVAAGARGGRRGRLLAAAGAVSVMAGAGLERFAIFAAGAATTRHPAYTVGPQRAGLVPDGDPS